MKTAIQFLDMVGLHKELEEEFVEVLRHAIHTGHFIGGDEVTSFEKEFAEYVGSKYCIGVNSGTDALRFALMAGNVPNGSIVITVPNTFIATVEAISQAGAKTAFVDVDRHTLEMSPSALRRFLEHDCDTSSGVTVHRSSKLRVSAVVPVHLYGATPAMQEIVSIATEFGLELYEDACQAQGSDYQISNGTWKRAGTFGRAAAFSFYPGKNLGALGEAGAITTNDPEIARVATLLREHGSKVKYFHEIEGYNGRLDAIQAGFLRRKLLRLDAWNNARRHTAETYRIGLANVTEVAPLVTPNWTRSNYHLFIVQAEQRDNLREFLEENGISTGLHYPLSLHLQDAYKFMGLGEGSFPVTEAAAEKILSLPMHPLLTTEEVERVIDTIKKFYQK